MIDGPPTLAAKSCRHRIPRKRSTPRCKTYLTAGVPVVWVVHPTFRHRDRVSAGATPTMVNDTGELTAEPHLPGFRCRVANLFR